MKEDKTLSVSAIQNGTVIDHIPAKSLFTVITILGLDKLGDNRMTFGTNFQSKQLGLKAIIKVSGKYFEDRDIDKIALVAPTAKLNIIKEYKVAEKRKVKVPEDVKAIAKCMNPNCVTNNEEIETKFAVIVKAGSISLKCRYCEKITDQAHMKIIK
ncbi:MAG: aspartate carbamoyltransferase regulatory subunit [Salinivirgaceae bacterium]|jgi:aspartate carbamoyltransferase regulatory subunit|nr:aspartate carbamoyltransferase regulatory subunit [Salinivirgaceae bacterium]